jgi:hypothetical protein
MYFLETFFVDAFPVEMAIDSSSAITLLSYILPQDEVLVSLVPLCSNTIRYGRVHKIVDIIN